MQMGIWLWLQSVVFDCRYGVRQLRKNPDFTAVAIVMLAVVMSDVEVDGEYQFGRRLLGSNPEPLRSLAAWLLEQQVEETVMESTAQYWKPVWGALERCLADR